MPDISGLIAQLSAPNLKGYWDTIEATTVPLPGEAIFPAAKIVGDHISRLTGKEGAAKIMKLSTYDTSVPMRGRISISKFDNDMALFREGKMLSEKDQRDIIMAYNSNSSDLKTFIQNVFDDRTDLIKSAHVSAERMRMDALSTLTINFSNNGVPFKATYGDPAKQISQVTTAWSDHTNSKPLDDIAAAKRAVNANNIVAYCSFNTFSDLLQNAQIKGAIFAAMSSVGLLTSQMLRQWIATNYGCTFVVFDGANAQYYDWDDAKKLFYPDNVVTFAPVGTLGETVFGSTPEETAQVLNPQRANIQTSIVDTGISVTTKYDVDNVNVETIVSAMVIPFFSAVDHVHVLNTKPAA